MDKLIQILKNGEKQKVTYFKSVYQQLHQEENFIDDLIEISFSNEDIRQYATWLIKNHGNQGGIFTIKQSRRIVELLPLLEFWLDKLHVLQTLPFLNLHHDDLDTIEEYVGEHLNYSQNFIRTSAYHGLYVLTNYKTELKEDVLVIFKEAIESDAAASVKARLRKLIKLLTKELK